MAKFEHPYIHEVAELGFPHPDRVMITHGSALLVRGVELARDEGDIDLVADQSGIRHLRMNLGWAAMRQHKYYDQDLPDKIRFTKSPDDRYDVFAHDFIPEKYQRDGRGRVYPDELFGLHDARFDQDEDTGIWVASIRFVIATKRGTGRPKDATDIARAEQFLQNGY
jgi:hypothetical protein